MCVGLFLPVSRRRRLWGKCTRALWPNSVHSSWPRDISLLLNALFYTSNSFVPVLRRHSTALPLPLSVLTSQISLFFLSKILAAISFRYLDDTLRPYLFCCMSWYVIISQFSLFFLTKISDRPTCRFSLKSAGARSFENQARTLHLLGIHCHWRSASPRLCHHWKLS